MYKMVFYYLLNWRKLKHYHKLTTIVVSTTHKYILKINYDLLLNNFIKCQSK